LTVDRAQIAPTAVGGAKDADVGIVAVKVVGCTRRHVPSLPFERSDVGFVSSLGVWNERYINGAGSSSLVGRCAEIIAGVDCRTTSLPQFQNSGLPQFYKSPVYLSCFRRKRLLL
jgi:hypothetical protein